MSKDKEAPSPNIVPGQHEHFPEKATENRRSFLRTKFGALLALPLGAAAYNAAVEPWIRHVADPEHAQLADRMERNGFATVHALSTVPRHVHTLVIKDTGDEMHLQTLQQGYEEYAHPERVDKHNKAVGTASGFAMRNNGTTYILSNTHVFDDAPDEWQRKATMEEVSKEDIAITSLNNFDEYPKHGISPLEVADIRNHSLAGRNVEITGLGREGLFTIQGKALEVTPEMAQRNFPAHPGDFCLLLPKDHAIDVYEGPLKGMSGAPVIESESKKAVGIFKKIQTVKLYPWKIAGSPEYQLLIFSGPEAVQDLLKEHEKHSQNNDQKNIQALLRSRKEVDASTGTETLSL